MKPQSCRDGPQPSQIVQLAVGVAGLVAPGVVAEGTVELDHQPVRLVLDVTELVSRGTGPWRLTSARW
ncbi:hypothetical protein [Nocardioides luteus]|uniref:hypothetical protein n=1 Tax=Nocardioides luteus TaxID=1844 RepID=UPI00115FB692|nr:hypothetical protein [Nocardioides luteus]